MDFFHCYNCYVQPGSQIKRRFWLTSCGHSFCEECTNSSESVCRVCHKNCKHLALTSDMPDDVKLFFTDTTKEFKKLLKVLLIQNKHCKLFMEEYVPKLEAKYLAAKLSIEKKRVEIQKAKLTIEEKNSEIESLKKTIKKLETDVQDMKKQFCILSQQRVDNSPGLPSTPSSYASTQDGVFTPKSGSSVNNFSTRLGCRQGKEAFISPPSSANSQALDKKRLMTIEQILKNKSSQSRPSPSPNLLRTPMSNQTFKMTINSSSPESSGDERWSSGSRRSALTIPPVHHFQNTPNKMRGRFF